jgi:hypothetical protein
VYSPLLPLLGARALTPEEDASLREHLVDCAWCQNQLAAYATVEDALRQRYALAPSARPLTLDDIMRASQFGSQPIGTDHPASHQPLRTTDLHDRIGSSQAAARGRDPRPQKPWATLGALAAVALLAVLAVTLFANLRLHPPSGVANTSCASALPGAVPAKDILGFAGVPLPEGAVMTGPKTSFGGPSQFTILESDVCYSSLSSPTPNPRSSGWSFAPSFPYQGVLLQARGQSLPTCSGLCYQIENSRYLAVEQIIDHGAGVFTYHVRLATPPPPPTCNANFSSSPLQGVQTAVEDVPLPPITFAVPDNAANLRGYDLCSSGTVASITAFLTSALPATGWTKVASNARCFYADHCWTRDLTVISWQVDDPTNWNLAYHPAAS